MLSIVARREHVAGEPTQHVDVIVEEDQDDRVDCGVGPGEERQQLVDLGRLLELRVDEREDVERVPGEDEEDRYEDEDPGAAEKDHGDYEDPVSMRTRVSIRRTLVIMRTRVR